MPRTARIVVPHHPHHILHRGIGGFPVFARADYCKAYLEHLASSKGELGFRVFAYCLMPDHVRLIIDPGDQPEHLGQLMKNLAGRHSQLMNGLSARRGRVWRRWSLGSAPRSWTRSCRPSASICPAIRWRTWPRF